MSDAFLTASFLLAFGVGSGATWWLWRRYDRIAPTLPGRERLVLQAFVVVSLVITAVAGYLGFLSLRRLAGLPPLDWSSIVTYLIAEAILFIPLYLAVIVKLVSEDRTP